MAMVQVQMYIPEFPQGALSTLRAKLIENLEGITESPDNVGAWRSEEKRLYKEPVVVLTALVDEDESIDFIIQALAQYKEDANQKCVLYTVQDIDVILL